MRRQQLPGMRREAGGGSTVNSVAVGSNAGARGHTGSVPGAGFSPMRWCFGLGPELNLRNGLLSKVPMGLIPKPPPKSMTREWCCCHPGGGETPRCSGLQPREPQDLHPKGSETPRGTAPPPPAFETACFYHVSINRTTANPSLRTAFS